MFSFPSLHYLRLQPLLLVLQVLRLDTSFFSSLNSVILLHMQNQIVRPMSSGFSAVLLEHSKNSFALTYAKVSNAKQDTRRVSSNLKFQGINKSSRGATEKRKTCHIERNHFWNLATNIVFEQSMDKLIEVMTLFHGNVVPSSLYYLFFPSPQEVLDLIKGPWWLNNPLQQSLIKLDLCGTGGIRELPLISFSEKASGKYVVNLIKIDLYVEKSEQILGTFI